MSDKKTVIITGGNSGLGYECALNIAADPEYRVILACRNINKAEKAKTELIGASGNSNILAMELDLSSFVSVRAFAGRYKDLNLSLYGVVCNAGINGTATGHTADGLDIVFETNHLGHFLLVNLLLPVMEPSGRIAVVSSDMHCPPGPELVWPGAMALARPDEQFATDTRRYSYSKLCNLYFTYELCDRLDKTDSLITVNAFNPGLLIDTNFSPDKSRFTPEHLVTVAHFLGSLKVSAKTLAEMITDTSLESVSGRYFDRGLGTKDSSPLSYDQEKALELWNTSVELTHLSSEEAPQYLLGK